MNDALLIVLLDVGRSLVSGLLIWLFIRNLKRRALERSSKERNSFMDLFMSRKDKVERDHLIQANSTYRRTVIPVRKRWFWKSKLPDKWRR